MLGECSSFLRGEALALVPLDRADERDLGRLQAIASHEVDLDRVVARPVGADKGSVADSGGGCRVKELPLERAADDRLDRSAAVGLPVAKDPRGRQVSTTAGDFRHVRSDEPQPEAQVRIEDRVARELRAGRHRVGGAALEHPLGVGQHLQRVIEGVALHARPAFDLAAGCFTVTDGFDDLPSAQRRLELRGHDAQGRRHEGVVVEQRTCEELLHRRAARPARGQQREPADDEVVVDRLRAVARPGDLRHRRHRQRLQRQLQRRAPVQRRPLLDEVLHHPHVAADAHQQHRHSLDAPVPGLLEV